jgi:sugar/nucleoside kinase (ribokinase family)
MVVRTRRSVSSVTVIGCVQADVVMSPVSELPAPGGALLAEQAAVRVGGAGANAALAAVEAGLDVRLIGAIGDDPLGALMREQLAPAGIADELSVGADDATGMTVVLESPERDRTFLTYLGVNERWEAGMIPDDALSCDNLLLCDYFVAPRLRGDPARGLLDTARSRGARTFFDTSWDPDGFSDETRAEVYALLPCVDVFLPNEVEACALAGIPDDPAAAARALQAASGGWVVVKLGAAGSLAVGPGAPQITAAAPAMSVSDTTGAGDAFNAGMIQALASGSDWHDALSQASRFATTIVARPSNDRYRHTLTEVQR